VTEPDGRYIRYAYDALGNRTLLADSMGAGQREDATQYAYDALNRLVQITDPQGGVTSYTYDADGNLSTTTLPNGVTETDTYDTLNRLIAIVDTNAGGATIGGFSYTLDVNGNRTREDDADGSHVVYTYDVLHRVTAEEHFESSGVSMGFEMYSYDALGNVMARSGTLLGDATFSYNGDNQLVSGAGSTYLYDAVGELVSVTDSTGQVTRYSYDARGRLSSSQAPDGTITSYTYDFQGVRQSQQGPGGLVKYLVDQANGPDSAQVVRESDATGATLRTYVIGARLLSFTESGNVRYYLADGLGSIRLLTDQTGAVTDTYSYSAYGVLLGHTGSSDNPFLFAGQGQDGSSGLLYLRARYYDPNTGRFLSRDAWSGSDQVPFSLNKYQYVLANPVNDTDPSGNEDLASLEAAEEGEAELIEEESESDAEDLHQLLKVEGNLAQFVGGLMTIDTAIQAAIFDPARVGYYFGGIRKSPDAREIDGRAAAPELTLIGGTMERRLGTTEYFPDPRDLEPTLNAKVYPRDPEFSNTVFIELGFYQLDFLPPPGYPLVVCEVGVVVHEFAHLASRGVITDTRRKLSYGITCLRFPTAEALLNAENYMFAVQAVTLG
jgi:RHS repeat-associated protein